MSFDLHPRFSPQNPTVVLRVFEIMVGVMFFHLPSGVMTQDIGVEGGAPCDLGWSIHRSRDALGHKRGSLDALCMIFTPLTPLLCVANFSVKNMACRVNGRKDAAAATEGSIFEAERGDL